MRTSTYTVAALAAIAVVVSVPAPRARADDAVTITATVLRIIDGDTVDIRDDVRGRLRVRLLGVDTPELRSPATPWAAGARKPPSSLNRH